MKKGQRGSIMVAVQALDRSSGALLRKAAMLARARGCDLELIHVIALPYAPAVSRRANLRQAAQEIVEDCKQKLLKLASSSELNGIPTEATVTWDYPAADGLVRQVLKRRPQVLLAESHRHARLARPFLSNTDWDLIRQCPCPVWLSKSAGKMDGPVIAALDPLHAHAKPSALDDIILQHALQTVQDRPARVLAFHAYALPTQPIVDGPLECRFEMPEEEIERYAMLSRRELDRLSVRYRIPAKNRLVAAGDPAFALPRMVKKHRASVVVMGAVSRSALARLFIGHTAERVIDALECDVLIVKPRGFKTRVVPRPRLLMALPAL
jgi:universal stress protein E